MKNFSDFSIRTKLLIGYASVFILALVLGSLFLFSSVREALRDNIERELEQSNLSIMNMVRVAVDASIRNHLRAVAETNEEIVRHYWRRSQSGELSETEAKALASRALLSQPIGKTGYIYCVNSQGVMQVHPEESLVGKDLSGNDFISKQKLTRQGYLEYDWANPGEQGKRPKALYMVYFGPWDWIISVSSYREEFNALFSVSDLRENILSMTFGETGYPYVIDTTGLLVIHPKLEGTNIYDSKDSDGRYFIRELCEKKNGRIIYPWKNPGESEAREKLVYFNYIPELDWIVASSSYLEEFYRPLNAVGGTMLLTFAAMIVLILPTTWWLASTITKPLHRLTRRFAKGAEGDYSLRMTSTNADEIGQLALFYNGFMDRLEESRQRLEASEQEYRGIFENAVEGIFRTSAQGRFSSANPSLARMLGYNGPEHLMSEVRDIGSQLYHQAEDRDKMLASVKERGFLSGFEARFMRRDGSLLWVSINARGLFSSDGTLVGVEGFINDITRRKDFEEVQARAKIELEERVRERTTELSGWVRELERTNAESALLREMGEMLQACRQVAETYPIVDGFLRRLFPGHAVALYTCDSAERTVLRPIVCVNMAEGGECPVVFRDDCWAIRQGKPYLYRNCSESVPCLHTALDSGCGPEAGALCVPLSSQEELIGLLHIRFEWGREGAGETGASLEDMRAKAARRLRRLGETIAEHLALALSNLKLRETLRQQSIQDALTGLFNRRYLEETIDRETSRMQRRGVPMAVLMLDIDHFKRVNDRYGHDGGDAVLRAFGEFLRRHTRGEDIVCRYGGEEFAIILSGATSEVARAKAEQLCEGVRGLRVPVQEEAIAFTVSIGLAVAQDAERTLGEVLLVADAALYEAKEQGRDRVVVKERLE